MSSDDRAPTTPGLSGTPRSPGSPDDATTESGSSRSTAQTRRGARTRAFLPRRKRLKQLARNLLIIWVASCIVLYAMQDYLLFPGRATQGQKQAIIREPRAGDPYELVHLTTKSGERIVALFGRATDDRGRDLPESESRTRPTILFFYRNGMCLADAFGEFMRFRGLGCNVLIPEYVGYGMSTGKPSEQALYETADAAYEHLQTRADVDATKIIASGWSLGAAVAIDVAHRRPVIGLATFSAFTSYVDMGRAMLPWFPAPVSMLARYRFASVEKVRTIGVPIFIAHGSHDRIIPSRMSERLSKEATKSPRVTTLWVDTDHNDIFEAREELWEPFERWLRSFSGEGVSPSHKQL